LEIKRQEGALKLRGWGRAIFAENLRSSPFNKDLSNETTFSLIHLDGQYLSIDPLLPLFLQTKLVRILPLLCGISTQETTDGQKMCIKFLEVRTSRPQTFHPFIARLA
jgi:hypothetical protein